MSQTLFNPSDFPLSLSAVEKDLAPLEKITFADAKVAEAFLATGVLKDVSEFEEAAESYIERHAPALETFSEDEVEDLASKVEAFVSRFRAEHDTPVSRLIDHADDADPVELANNASGNALRAKLDADAGGGEIPVQSPQDANPIVDTEPVKRGPVAQPVPAVDPNVDSIEAAAVEPGPEPMDVAPATLHVQDGNGNHAELDPAESDAVVEGDAGVVA